MKKLVIGILALFYFSSNAQTSIYHPFPDSNAVWNEEGIANFGGPTLWHHWQQRFYIDGDTTVVNTYHKIYSKSIDEYPSVVFFCQWPIAGIPATMYYGGIREDTLLKKVYYLPPGYLSDTLLYDFNVHVGDTLPSGFNHLIPFIVNHIDSMFDGTNYRNFYSLTDTMHSDSVVVIEGIGSTWGLFWSLDPPFEVFNFLHCFQQNGSTFFTDSCVLACEMATNVRSNSNTYYSLKISPNPFHSRTTIELNKSFENAELLVYNSQGEQTMRQKTSSQSVTFYRSGLPNGIYFLQIINGNGEQLFGKFIIE